MLTPEGRAVVEELCDDPPLVGVAIQFGFDHVDIAVRINPERVDGSRVRRELPVHNE